MTRLLAFPLCIFLAASLLAVDELPQDPEKSLDIEPPLLIEEIPSRDSVQSTPDRPPEKTFGITEVTATDSPDADAAKRMELKIGVKVRPNTVIDDAKVKIQVFLYDTVDNKEVVLTDARVSYRWLTPHHDWKDTKPEALAVTYLRSKKKITLSDIVKSKTTKELSGKGTDRKYLGYLVRIYYNDQLQAVKADPTKLLTLFPPPLTVHSK